MVRFVFILFLAFICRSEVSAASPRLFLTFTAPSGTPYVGEETPFQIKLFDRIGLTEIALVTADWQNVDVFMNPPLPEETTVQNGASYTVRTFDFSLLPKSAGEMSLPPFCLSAKAPSMISVRDLPQDVQITPDGRLALCTTSFTLRVKALPEHSPPLFVAQEVELFEGVVPKDRFVKQGMPVKRSLVLTAKGTLPAYLPDFRMPEQKRVKTYAGKTDRTRAEGEKMLVSAIRQTIVFIPETAGELTLPAISVFWMNARTNKIEESKIPAYTLTVLPAEQQPEEPLPENRPPAFPDEGRQADFPVWPKKKIAPFLFLAGLFLTAKVLQKKRSQQKKFEKEVEEACLAEDLKKAESALLDWGRDKFPDNRMLNLSELRQIFNGRAADFESVLSELEQFLYGTGRFAKHLPTARESLGKKVLHSFRAVKRMKIKRAKKPKKNLPPLYPEA